ncbi:MAG: glycoside hydrolase [Candidatus Kapabacteria bacterium]|nr:glycoside hydrolase [Candidatus Kapabacteria bacterium]
MDNAEKAQSGCLRVAILWHHHQPYYTVGEEMPLPWVRLHAAKDYCDLSHLHFEFPDLRLTYNVVPSLILQLQEYQGTVRDVVQRLSSLEPATLSEQEKRDILTLFFRCNVATMVHPYQRYNELYVKSRDENNAIRVYTIQDWLDLQVWYNLTWIGELSRQHPAIQSLLKKGGNFTVTEKNIVLSFHELLMRNVLPVLSELQKAGIAELSVTPLYHPILPLLIDSDVAKEATPELPLPQRRYHQLNDADYHVQRGQLIFEQTFNTAAKGMWLAEGSISDSALSLIATRGITWTATDEHVLRNTLGDNYTSTSKYFPYRIALPYAKHITLFFRDHSLSDAIGFDYQHWKAEDAAANFIERLCSIRSLLIKEHGESVLDEAVVPVILDGENCWEYYQNNGVDFLRALYKCLSEHPELRTVHFSTVTEQCTPVPERTLEHITAGSWIFGNFKIWIGHDEKNAAWDELRKARKLIDSRRVTHAIWKEAMEHIYIAEGSDWFWWYGDDHSADSRHIFDEIFRYHLRAVYELFDEKIPAVLKKPMMKNTSGDSSFSAMHKVSESDL